MPFRRAALNPVDGPVGQHHDPLVAGGPGGQGQDLVEGPAAHDVGVAARHQRLEVVRFVILGQPIQAIIPAR